jgi:putative alpha-1,2-mannosidase
MALFPLMTIESVSKTLEYAYDDWCIAQMAQILNKEDYEYS